MSERAKSYSEILRSSAMIGGSQAVVIGIGMLRVKAMAVLLGPAGFGLMALFNSILDLAASLASLGVERSGVRQIAESVGTGDQQKIARTAKVLRRLSVLFGTVGAALLVAVSPFVSQFTFGTDDHVWGVALLSIAVLCRVVTGGQAALIQGMRRISDLAMLGIIGAVGGTVLGVLLVHALGDAGIAPSLVAVAATGLLASWWYSRRVKAGLPKVRAGGSRNESLALVKLGAAFMASGFLMLGAAYAVRTMVIRLEGLEAAGLYQAAWTVGGLYIGMVLQAMGADFYPRLTAVVQDHSTANQIVNEQTTVGLLIAAPGVVATLVLAPLLLTTLYSEAFTESENVLQWFCIGMMLRVITWPLGYIIVAQGRQALYFGTELAWATVNVMVSWALLQILGLVGAAVAFVVSYVFHWVMVYCVVHRLTGFRWSAVNIYLGSVCILIAALALTAELVFNSTIALIAGIVILTFSVAYSAHEMLALVPRDRWPRSLVALTTRLGVDGKNR